MSERICSKCGESKPETTEFFRKRGTNNRGGLRPDCRDCCAKRDRAYYAQNYQTKIRAYRKANAEQIAAYMASYMPNYYRTENGRAAIRKAQLAYTATLAGRLSQVMAQQRRKARVAGQLGEFTKTDWAACLAAFDRLCAYCGEPGLLTQEHVLPISRGGLHDRSNVVPACRSCNCQKFSKLLDEWYPLQPFFSEERLMRIADYLGALVG